MFENLRGDIRQARKVNGRPGWWGQHVRIIFHFGFMAVLSYRFARWARGIRLPVARHVLMAVAGFCRRVTQVITGVDISPEADIGPGFVVHTCFGVFVANTKIGANCVVQTGVAITQGPRSIGDNVYFGPGSKVIARPIIGNNVLVVANSVVMTDVADNTTVIGVPARIHLPRGPSFQFSRPPDAPADTAQVSR